MTRRPMRYFVKDSSGRELVVPSLADLHALYTHGFLGDDDQVRAETSERWVRAGAMQALQGVREGRAESPHKVGVLIGAIILLATAVGIMLAR